MSSTDPWRRLQDELRDLAFLLDRQGDHGAADVATSTAARIAELLEGGGAGAVAEARACVPPSR